MIDILCDKLLRERGGKQTYVLMVLWNDYFSIEDGDSPDPLFLLATSSPITSSVNNPGRATYTHGNFSGC
ncbi:MAG TPA: hypothetical protein ENF69_04860 [Euryarchaeota archaeon]|nr:hypothetical protein [Euryarchaeota archaeon]